MRLPNRLTFTGGPFRLLPFMERMELNDSITISNEYQFREVGNKVCARVPRRISAQMDLVISSPTHSKWMLIR
jgi:hypothetical protein